MATKKSQTAKKVAPKATKTVTTSTGKTKTMPVKKPATKPTPNTSTSKPPKKAGCIIASIIGAVAAIALFTIGVIALVNNLNHKADSSLVVENGNGEKVTTKYISYLDDTFRLKVPDELKAIDQKDLENGTDAAKSIIAAYANDAKTVSLGIATNKDAKLSNDQVKAYAENIKTVFETTGEVSDIDYFTKGGHNIASMRITIKADGTSVIEDIAFFSLSDQLVMITITYGDKEAKEWQPVNDFIINSLDFKK